MSFFPRIRHGRIELPVVHVRGGTSTGAILHISHLPSDPALRAEVLCRLMGAGPGAEATRQSSGLGRGYPTSNKVLLVAKADGDGADVETTLAQLAADKSEIDWRVTCGNLTAALPLFALDQGLVKAGDPETSLRIWNTNTAGRIHAVVRTPGGVPSVPADTEIPGVTGRFPGVELNWLEPGGQKTGALLPTGRPVDVLKDLTELETEELNVSCVDAAVPMVVVKAADLDKTARESPDELDEDPQLQARLREIRVQAGAAMGLRNPDGTPMSSEQLAQSETMPKICMIAPGDDSCHLHVRYFTPQKAHRSLAVSGGSCLAAAVLIPGTLAHEMSVEAPRLRSREDDYDVLLGHPVGILQAKVRAQLRFGVAEIHSVGYTRSAQILMRGYVPLYDASDDLLQAFEALTATRT